MPRGKHSKRWYQREPEEDRDSPRRVAQRELRRSQRRKFVRVVGRALLVLLLVAGLSLGVYSLFSGDDDEEPLASGQSVAPGGKDSVTTLLVFGTDEKKPQKGAIWMTLLSLDEENERGAIVYLPAHTASEVPGRGLMGTGEAFASGGVPLLLVATENLLGIEIDRYLEVSDSDARLLFDATGPISVDVPTEVKVPAGKNRARLLFTEGPQSLSSKFLRDLLYVVGLDGDDAELGSRHLAFWDGLFEEFNGERGELESAVKEAGGALAESDASVNELASFFGALDSLEPSRRALASVPVEQVSVGGNELYEIDAEDLQTFLEDIVGADPVGDDEVRVQVLNGNGVPGIGEQVAEKLQGEYRVILSGNARRLDYKHTLIVTYDDSDEGRQMAEQAKELLGVGVVQVSAQGQGIVDLTIVVGKDFLRAN